MRRILPSEIFSIIFSTLLRSSIFSFSTLYAEKKMCSFTHISLHKIEYIWLINTIGSLPMLVLLGSDQVPRQPTKGPHAGSFDNP